MSVCGDEKNCQSTQCNRMKPVMKKSSYMWLAKPAILQSHSKKSVCDDKNCQATKK